jgi:hypothetical protein
MAQMRKQTRPYRLTSTPRYDPPRVYDLMRLPKQAKAAGQAWADDFARLSTKEQQAIVWRAVTAAARAKAIRSGKPVPIFFESIVKPLDGGGYELVSTAPLRPEWGGDGRTEADAEREAKRPPWHLNNRANLELYFAAERIKAQITAMGGEIITTDDPDPAVPKPRRKASA